MNVADPDIFAKAQAQVIGQNHSAPMIAFGTMKRLSAWKMYCRASGVSVETANKISDNLKKYELDVKHADDDDKDSINPYDYVPSNLHEQLRMSEKYLGMIDSISPHPCAYLVCNSNIRRDFGLIRLKGDVIAVFIDGATADGYGYLKNDDLKVSVIELIADIYKRIGIKQPTVPQLLKMTDCDTETWRMYADGLTMGLNQAEKEKSTNKVMVYKPHNISQMAAFCAGIRPAFQSMIDKLLNRQHFAYDIPALDKLLQTTEIPESFILYQEQMMSVLQWAGFTAPQSYASIKAIAKKHPQKVKPLKEQFLKGFSERLINEENTPVDVAKETSDKVWTIISDACGYGFNSSHATAVALDSVYVAWAKAHHPYETYCSLLSLYANDGDKDRIALAKAQMKKGFGITISPCKFRQDNRSFYIDKDNKTISDALTSIKGVGKKDADALWKLSDGFYVSFVDLLIDMTEYRGALNTAVISTLIKCDYFSEFGGSKKLMKIFEQFTEGKNKYSKALIESTILKRINILYGIEQELPDESIDWAQVISFEVEKFGTPVHTYTDMKNKYAVIDIDDKYSYKLKLYNVSNGNVGTMRIKKNLFSASSPKVGDVITIDRDDWERKQVYKFIDGKSVPVEGAYDNWIKRYNVALTKYMKEG